MTLEILNSEEDFKLYCKKLDMQDKYKNDHKGHPYEYPCKVISVWEDDPIDPYYYDYEFYYQKEIVCPCCNYKILVWDIGDN